MRVNACLALALLFIILVLNVSDAIGQNASFQETVMPFLKQHCVRCHGAKKSEAKLRLDTLRGVFEPNGGETNDWANVLRQLQSRQMPPKGEPAPDSKLRSDVVDLVRNELRKIGKGDSAELAYPDKANYLDHNLLFGTKSTSAPATPSRIWRISPFVYTHLITRLSPPQRDEYVPNDIPIAFGLTRDPGFRDYAFRYTVGAAETKQMLLNGRMVLDRRVNYGPFMYHPLSQLARLDEAPGDEQKDAAVVWMFEQILRRKPKEDELERYGHLLTNAIERFGNKKGVVQGLAPVFVHPEAMFRKEWGAGPADQHGRVMLAPRELAFAIAYGLTDSPPDEKLMQAVAEKRLNNREDARRQIERLLSNSEIDKPRIVRFFREYFDYGRAEDVFKDKPLVHPNNMRIVSLVKDTDQLVQYFLDKDVDVLRQLLTTNKSFVHYSFIEDYRRRMKHALASPEKHRAERLKHARPNWLGKHYNMTNVTWQPDQPLTFPKSQRAGILTQPSWLFAHSENMQNQPIQRGKWIREQLLGGTIPDTPITVDAILPNEPHNTLRERMRVTREEYCWSCHQHMNPLGLPFEMFDHYGQFRAKEKVVVRKDRGGNPVYEGKPVNSTGKLADSADGAIEGPVESAIELVHRLSRSEYVHQVFVRHAFRYWMGRNETLEDAPTLQDAYRAYQDNGGSMKALITSLLTSDSFLYRVHPR